MILGIDVSHWNGALDWYDLWQQGYRFVFIKASEGTGWKDGRLLQNHAGAKEGGFLVGPYHFFRSDYNGIAQANWMYTVAGSMKWDLPPVLDVESNHGGLSTTSYAARVRACLGEMQRLWSRKPIVYTSASKWKYTGNVIVDADLWVAHYTTRPQPYIPPSWEKWLFWQYTSTPIDQNRFDGTMEQLKQYCGVGNGPTPTYPINLTQAEVDAIISIRGKL